MELGPGGHQCHSDHMQQQKTNKTSPGFWRRLDVNALGQGVCPPSVYDPAETQTGENSLRAGLSWLDPNSL